MKISYAKLSTKPRRHVGEWK